MLSRVFLALALFSGLELPIAKAGWLIAPGVKWASFTLRPDAGEPTPNYYGYGFGLSMGYSARQVFDMAVFGSYVPARVSNAKFGAEDASFLAYGGELALRLGQSVYLGFRGGAAKYQLITQTRDDELTGRWQGPAGGFSLGAISKINKRNFLQTSFDILHTVVSNEEDADLGKRRIDSFSITISYVFNGFKSYLVHNKIFSNFLDSVIFF